MAHHDPSSLCGSLYYYRVVKSTLNKLIKDVSDEIKSRSTHFQEDDLRKLEETMTSISTALPDPEQLAIKADVGGLVLDLKEVVHYIEDLLDEAATQQLEQKVHWRKYMLAGIISRQSRRSFSVDLKLLLVRLDGISASLSSSSCLKHKLDVTQPTFSNKTRGAIETSSYYNQLKRLRLEETILGREEDKERLIHCILSPSNSLQHPSVINVTGPGGIGKTALLKLVCNDSRVSSSFDFVSWTSYYGSLSYEGGLENLTRDIERSSLSVGMSSGESGELENRLCSILQGQKFLLVVDDIKHKLPPEWEKYMALLNVGSPGSTMILISWSSPEIRVFTRSFEVGAIPERECWSLFKRSGAFDEEAEQAESSLKAIGRSIVKKCGGSPLAVETIANLLRNYKGKHYWEQIDQSKLWGLDTEAWTAWRISLELLPVELSTFYATYSIISRGSEVVNSDKLIWFWMAQGLLQSTKENEDLAHSFCKELQSMNCLPFFLSGNLNSLSFCNELQLMNCLSFSPSGNLGTRIGRQFVKWLSREQIGHENDLFLPSPKMHLMWTRDGHLPKLPTVRRIPKNQARTLFFRDGAREVSKPLLEGMISNLKRLRVLLLHFSLLEELPESIGNLKLLRYLSLAGSERLRGLPDSICKLVNLQILDLSYSEELKSLPKNMHKLVSMRYLLLSGKLRSLPQKTWNSLHHLKIHSCQRLSSLGQGVETFSALRTLDIFDCPSIVSLPNSKNCLTSLKEFRICDCDELDLTGWDGLLHLRSLKSLIIGGLPKLSKFPVGLQSAADSLEHLSIYSCENLNLTGWDGLLHLRSLKSLIIGDLPKLSKFPIGLQSVADSLEQLVIRACENLTKLPEEIHALKNLQVLEILDCPNLVKRCERVTGDDWHLIYHIPMIYLDNEVIRTMDTSTVQKQPGALNLSPSKEIKSRPASATSPSEIIPVPEDPSYLSDYDYPPSPSYHYSVQSPSKHRLSTSPREGDVLPTVEHPHPAPLEEHLRASLPYGMNINVQPASIPVTHRPGIDPIGLENQGASSNEEPFCRQVLELEKEVEGKRILFLFREGCEFEKEMIIQLWMALELLTDEGIGTYYFEKLVSEGYVWSSANSLYKVNTAKLNSELDMIAERQKYAMLDNGSGNDAASAETLHVSVVCDEINESIFTTLGRFNKLRVLLFLHNYGSRLQEVPRDIFLCYESLVALDLSGAHIKELPSSAEKMIHLRFLDLSWTFIELLPERINHFAMLQTLKLKGCSHLHRLPKELKGLTELRYLDLDVLGQLASFPEGIGSLVNLRTLSAFPVGIEEGLKISELKHLDNLTGEFCIAKLENVRSAEEAKEASLTAKISIKKLELRWSDHQFQEPKKEDEMILKNLCPYSDLEEIQILCYPGTSFPGWITDVSFHKLVSITLFRCVHVSVLPLLEKLPELACLELISLNSVVDVNFKGEVGHVAFPKLQKLGVDEMLNLESWAEAQEGDYPCLINVSIKDCPMLPELPSLPYLPSIKNLEVSGCTKLAFVSEKELSPSLQQLIVEDCPLIIERCSEQGGEDWHKIHHVLTIWIDQVAIKTNEDLIEEEDENDDENDDDDDDDDESYYWDVFE